MMMPHMVEEDPKPEIGMDSNKLVERELIQIYDLVPVEDRERMRTVYFPESELENKNG